MAEKRTNGRYPPKESGGLNGLTPIHGRIHCVATPDTTDDVNELEVIVVDNLFGTLAEVALAIARRRKQVNQ